MSPSPSLQRLGGGLILSLCLCAAASSAPGLTREADRIVNLGAVSHGVPPCRSCHGAAGEGVPVQNGPRLAHLDADYLGRQLDAFASGDRHSVVMSPIARALTPDQRALLSTYFMGLPTPPTVTITETADARRRRGQALALAGDWSRGAPPCVSCHGPGGEGVGSVTPPLTGQTQAYLLRQLTAFRDGDRKGPLGLMQGIAKRLPMSDLRAAAEYYARLRSTAPIPARAQ